MASMIAKAVKCMMFLMVPLLSTIPAISKDWLGDYKGGVVPGYEVRASDLVYISWAGHAGSVNEAEAMNKLSEQCKKKGGMALVNVEFYFALGAVPVQDKIVSPGMRLLVSADCVTDMKPR